MTKGNDLSYSEIAPTPFHSARAERSLPDRHLMASQETAKQAKNAVESAAKKAAEARQQCAKHDPPSMLSVVPLRSITVAHCHPSRMFHTGSPLCCFAPKPWRLTAAHHHRTSLSERNGVDGYRSRGAGVKAPRSGLHPCSTIPHLVAVSRVNAPRSRCQQNSPVNDRQLSVP